jgi:hypothetical protein
VKDRLGRTPHIAIQDVGIELSIRNRPRIDEDVGGVPVVAEHVNVENLRVEILRTIMPSQLPRAFLR